MEISCEDKGNGIVVVSMGGEVDMSSSPKVREAFAPYFPKKKKGKSSVKSIIVDLSQVKYMDSSGIATLVEALQNSNKTGISLRLAALSDAVKDVFELARLNHIFEIHKTLDAALAKG